MEQFLHTCFKVLKFCSVWKTKRFQLLMIFFFFCSQERLILNVFRLDHTRKRSLCLPRLALWGLFPTWTHSMRRRWLVSQKHFFYFIQPTKIKEALFLLADNMNLPVHVFLSSLQPLHIDCDVLKDIFIIH